MGSSRKGYEGTAPAARDERHRFAIPGIASLHSHAFPSAAMAGLAETRGNVADTFWTWRETMYRFALKHDPRKMSKPSQRCSTSRCSSKAILASGKFHYLHHEPRRRTLRQSRGDGDANCARRRGVSGIGLTLLPCFHAHSSFGGAAPHAEQRRFICSIDQVCQLTAGPRALAVQALAGANVGVAPHSLRAVTPEQCGGHRADGRSRAGAYPRRRTDQGGRGLHCLVGPAAC